MAKADKPGKQEGEERFLGNEVNVLFRMFPKNRIGLVLPRGAKSFVRCFFGVAGCGNSCVACCSKRIAWL